MKNLRRGRGRPLSRKHQRAAQMHAAEEVISDVKSLLGNDALSKCFQLQIVNSCVHNADVMLPQSPQPAVFAPFYTRAWSPTMDLPQLDHMCETNGNSHTSILVNPRNGGGEAPRSRSNASSSSKHRVRGARANFFERTYAWRRGENDANANNHLPPSKKNEKLFLRNDELSAEQWMGHIAHVILGRHSQLSSSSSLYYRLRHPCISRMQARIIFITCADMHAYFIQHFPSIRDEEPKSGEGEKEAEKGGRVYIVVEDEAASSEPSPPKEGSLNEEKLSLARKEYDRCVRSFKGAYYLLINYGSNPVFVNTLAVLAGRSVALASGDIISFLECAFDRDGGILRQHCKKNEPEEEKKSVDIEDPQESVKPPPLKRLMMEEDLEMSFESNDRLFALQQCALSTLLANHTKRDFDTLDCFAFAAGISREGGGGSPRWSLSRIRTLARRFSTITGNYSANDVFAISPRIQSYFSRWLQRQRRSLALQDGEKNRNSSEKSLSEATTQENELHGVSILSILSEEALPSDSYPCRIRKEKEVSGGGFKTSVEGESAEVSSNTFTSDDDDDDGMEEEEAEGIVPSPLRGRLVLQAKPRRRREDFPVTEINEKEEEKESSMSPIKKLLNQLRGEQKEEKTDRKNEDYTEKLRLLSPLNKGAPAAAAAAAEPTVLLSRSKRNTTAADPHLDEDDEDNQNNDSYDKGNPNGCSPLAVWRSNVSSSFPSSSSIDYTNSSSDGLLPSGIPRILIRPAVLPVFIFTERSRSPERTTREASSCREILRARNGGANGEGEDYTVQYIYYYEEEAIEEKEEKIKKKKSEKTPSSALPSSSGRLKETAAPQDLRKNRKQKDLPKNLKKRLNPSDNILDNERNPSEKLIVSNAEVCTSENEEELFWIDETETSRRRKRKKKRI